MWYHDNNQTEQRLTNHHVRYPLRAVAKTLVASSLSSLLLSDWGNSWKTAYTDFPLASLTAPSLFPATAPAMAPGKLATMNPNAPPLSPPTRDQNLPVGRASCPSARPSSLSISSNTLPN